MSHPAFTERLSRHSQTFVWSGRTLQAFPGLPSADRWWIPSDPDPSKRLQQAVRGKLNSWDDFPPEVRRFPSVQLSGLCRTRFFSTGGQTCYVARVGVAGTPPATAFMPLPAAITSSVIGHLSASVDPRASMILLDTTTNLAVGSVVTVGDPAVAQLLRVDSIVDSQTIVVHPGLEAAHDVGEPVFAFSGPAIAASITFVAAATAPGQTQLHVDSSDVLSVGSVIAIGDALTGECVSVMSIVDDQTVTVQPPLQAAHVVKETQSFRSWDLRLPHLL